MSVLKVGIATFEQMKARTLAIARGEIRVSPSDPKVWVPSADSFSKVLSSSNRELLSLISSARPKSLKELAEISGRRTSNLSRTLKTMEKYGLITLAKAKGQVVPRVIHDRVRIEFAITLDEPIEGTRNREKRMHSRKNASAVEFAMRRPDASRPVAIAPTQKAAAVKPKDMKPHAVVRVERVRPDSAVATRRRKH